MYKCNHSFTNEHSFLIISDSFKNLTHIGDMMLDELNDEILSHTIYYLSFYLFHEVIKAPMIKVCILEEDW